MRILSALLVFSLIIGVTDADAQRSKKKKKKKDTTDEYFDDSGSLAGKLWYGSDITLNFPRVGISDGSNVYQGNGINFGLAPMVGYKVTPNFSVGPKAEIIYHHASYDYSSPLNPTNRELKLNAVDYGIGAFARFMFLQAYFIQAEYQMKNIAEPFAINNVELQIESLREWQSHPYLGVGYASMLAGNLGLQVSLLWDFGREFSSSSVPIDYRIGLNYRLF